MTTNYPPTAHYPPPPSHLPPPSQPPTSQPPPGSYRPPPPAASLASPSPPTAVGGAYRPPGSFAAPPPAAGAFNRPPPAAGALPAGLAQYRPPGAAPIASPLPPAVAGITPPRAQPFAVPSGIQQPLPSSTSTPPRFAPPLSSLPSSSSPSPAAAYVAQPPPASSLPRSGAGFAPPNAGMSAPLPAPLATNGMSHSPPADMSRGVLPASPYPPSQPAAYPNAATASPYPPTAALAQPSPAPLPAASLPPPRGLGQSPASAPPPAMYGQQQLPPQHPSTHSSAAYPQQQLQPHQNGFASPGPAVLNGIPAPNPPNGALPPPHPAAASAYQHSSYSAHQPAHILQQPYTNNSNINQNNMNGYDYDAANSQFSSTATSPYSSGQNSPAFSSQPQPSYPPASMYPSQSPIQAPKKVDRIDPKQIPRPSDLKGNVIKYYTRSGAAPPSSTADYIAIDEGNASPRFMRLTTNQIAHEQELIDTTRLSIGAIIQPLAPLGDGEEAVPVIDYATGPVRCGRCMAYVNPFFQFVDGGNSFVCSICGMKSDCPVEYRCNLDANGQRRDRTEKAELCRGSVEYVVGKDFIARPVSDPCYLFAVDVSYAAVMSGLTAAAVDAIRHSLEVMKSNERVRAGVMTYDSTIHFYALSPPRTEPLMYVMSDIDDVFLPCPSSEVLVPLASPEHYQLLMALLDMVPIMYNKETRNEDAHSSSFGAAVAVAAECALPTGGKVLITVSSLPTQGAGALTNRDNSQLYGTEKERTLQQPASSFYHTIATKCAEHAVSVDLFICANTYVDLATMSVLSEKTGGQVFMYPSYSARKDAYAFQRDLYHDVTRVTGFDAVMIVRVSAGLRVAEHYGNFFHRTASEMDLPSIDADKTFAIRMEHDGKLKDKSEACVQCALLYTTAQGQRRIRVHTVGVPITSALSNIYRFSDLDAIINLSLRQAARQLLDSTTPTDAQHALTSACIDSLFVYRKFCASATSAGQLILPEPLKLLPLCTLGMIKHPLLQEGVSADERSYLYSFINSMPCYVSVAFVVPRLYALHDMPSHACVYDDKGRVSLPPSLSLSSESISIQGLYLLDDARFLYLYLGADLSPQTIEEVFDGGWTLRDGPAGSVAGRVQVLISTLRLQKANYQPLQLISRRTSGTTGGESLDESLFFAHMIEDSGRGRGGLGAMGGATKGGEGGGGSRRSGSDANAMSYIDFLCWIHKKIQAKFY